MAAAALTEAPPRERPVVDAALFVSTDELRLWADSDEENGPPVYRRRSGTLFRHAPATPEVTRRRALRGIRCNFRFVVLDSDRAARPLALEWRYSRRVVSDCSEEWIWMRLAPRGRFA